MRRVLLPLTAAVYLLGVVNCFRNLPEHRSRAPTSIINNVPAGRIGLASSRRSNGALAASMAKPSGYEASLGQGQFSNGHQEHEHL